MLTFSIGLLLCFPIKIFIFVTIVSMDSLPLPISSKPFFKGFMLSNILKALFQLLFGCVFFFSEVDFCVGEGIEIYYYCLFVLHLLLCSNITLIHSPPEKTICSYFFNQMSFIMISSLSNFISVDDSFQLLGVTSIMAVLVTLFIRCSFELSGLFFLYGVTFLLEAWMGEVVAIVYETILWGFVFLWFLNDKRPPPVEYIAPTDEQEFETINLT